MPYCRRCGTRLPDDAVYCPACGTLVEFPARHDLKLADWGERFLAWLIDALLVGVFLSGFKWFFSLTAGIPFVPIYLRWLPLTEFGFDNIIYFLYWTFLEGGGGQSIGKIVLNLRTVRLNGEPLTMGNAAIESLGKAFLLPLDCIIGWLFFPAKKQRLFNYLSGTVVVKASS